MNDEKERLVRVVLFTPERTALILFPALYAASRAKRCTERADAASRLTAFAV